jgi:hypothetical protein
VKAARIAAGKAHRNRVYGEKEHVMNIKNPKSLVTSEDKIPKNAVDKHKTNVTTKDYKYAFTISVSKNLIDEISGMYEDDNCASRSEFIEKAIKFYVGYLKHEKNVNYLSPIITNSVDSTITGTEQRLSRLLFKIAVEIGKIANITAAANGIDNDTLKELHVMVVNEVKKINGILTFEKAVEYQKE